MNYLLQNCKHVFLACLHFHLSIAAFELMGTKTTKPELLETDIKINNQINFRTHLKSIIKKTSQKACALAQIIPCIDILKNKINQCVF